MRRALVTAALAFTLAAPRVARAQAEDPAQRAAAHFASQTDVDEAADGDQAVAAGALGMSDGAVKVAVHRLRRRFREAVRQEVAHTLNTPDQVAAEMRQLFAALGG